jgi:hypothetical protein
MSNKNLVTGKTLETEVVDALQMAMAAVDYSAELTPHDAPYFFVRVDPKKRLRDQVFSPDPFAPTQITWGLVSERVPVEGALRDEIEFLEGIGLAMLVPNSTEPDRSQQYAVSPRIEKLYAPDDGVFMDVNENRKAKAHTFFNLLIHYVLPGMYWRNYYVTDGLAPHLHLTEKLGQEMLEIGELWDRLVAKFGWAEEE